ncbi:phospholipase B1, membrane-associated-like [Glandiceps talaboti]
MKSVVVLLFAISVLSSPVFANTNWEDFAVEVQQMSANVSQSRQNLLRSNLFRSSNDKAYGLKSFRCDVSVRGAAPATSVHNLRPSDIQVVGALGDSLTAANGAGASWVLEVLTEYRGLSFSAGGDKTLEEVSTLPNILKKYNPNLVGFSVGKGSDDDIDVSVFNVAVPGSKAFNLPGQARRLIARMKAHPNVDYANDWKLVTLFIGGNDLCDWIKEKEEYSADNYIAHIKNALDILHEQMPRTFVNLVSVPNVVEISKVKGLKCKALRLYLCPSVLFAKNKLEDVHKEYLRVTRELNADGKYDTKDDFTVVVQPYFEDTHLPKKSNGRYDTSYFAPDCFHFSGKGHGQAAHALWNNMLQPVGQKETRFDFDTDTEPLCPSKNAPFFYTSKNSKPSQLRSSATLHKSLAAAAPLQLAAHGNLDQADDSMEFMNFGAAAAPQTGDAGDAVQGRASPSSSLSIGVGVLGTALIVGCIVAAVVLAKRRSKSNREEERHLLNGNPEA